MPAKTDRPPRTVDHALSLVRGEVRAMPGYTPGEQVPGAIKLNTNECAYPPSPRVMQTLARIADDRLRLYPDPVSRRLREAAADRYGVTPDQVLAGNGSDDCLTIIYRAFLSPGDRVVCPWPTYGLYETLATLQGAAMATAPFAVSADGRHWGLPPALAADPARLILIANPNNPSATLIPVDDLRQLAGRRRGVHRLRQRPGQHLALAGSAPEPDRAADVLEELQPGGRAAGTAVRGGAAGGAAEQGQGQLQRQRDHPGAGKGRAGGPRVSR
jgi:hypothetical protein